VSFSAGVPVVVSIDRYPRPLPNRQFPASTRFMPPVMRPKPTHAGVGTPSNEVQPRVEQLTELVEFDNNRAPVAHLAP